MYTEKILSMYIFVPFPVIFWKSFNTEKLLGKYLGCDV